MTTKATTSIERASSAQLIVSMVSKSQQIESESMR